MKDYCPGKLNLLVFIILCILGLARSAEADTIVVTALDSGWYRSRASGIDHTPSIRNFIVGGSLDDTEYRNFFLFNIPTITQPILSATFKAYVEIDGVGISNVTQVGTWTLFDVTTNLAQLLSGSTPELTFNDLGSGTVYGSMDFTVNDRGKTFSVAFNEAGRSVIESTSGLLALGGAVTTLSPGTTELLFSGSGDHSMPRLELELVPEPATFWLVLLGVLIGSRVVTGTE